jgi:ATP-dependent DNA helicase PIF1
MIVSDLVSLNSQQQEILQGMEDTLDHLFITGRAGTGKTTLLHEFVATTAKSVAVCAPTGVAALAIGGQTIHSLLRLPLGIIGDRELGFIPKESLAVLAAIDALVIDEVSMVSADVLDAIDRRLRQAKRRRNSPFGGIQMIMFGDPYQLSPVVTRETEKLYEEAGYRSPWFFDAKVWAETELEPFELDTIHRQADGEFRSVLNALREGRMDPEMGRMLNDRGMRERPKDLELITLTTTNASASKINGDALGALPGRPVPFDAIIDSDFGRHYPADEKLLLKVNARVMFLRNDTAGPDGPRFVNGTIGIVKKIKADTVIVEVDGAAIEVERMTWQKTEPVASEAGTKTFTHRVLGEFTQFPLRLAWAVTIHKAQGKTLDAAVIDLGQRAFAPGQTYVAFSRLTSLDGLYLKRPLSPSDIIVDQDVLRFMSNPRGTNRLI